MDLRCRKPPCNLDYVSMSGVRIRVAQMALSGGAATTRIVRENAQTTDTVIDNVKNSRIRAMFARSAFCLELRLSRRLNVRPARLTIVATYSMRAMFELVPIEIPIPATLPDYDC